MSTIRLGDADSGPRVGRGGWRRAARERRFRHIVRGWGGLWSALFRGDLCLYVEFAPIAEKRYLDGRARRLVGDDAVELSFVYDGRPVERRDEIALPQPRAGRRRAPLDFADKYAAALGGKAEPLA